LAVVFYGDGSSPKKEYAKSFALDIVTNTVSIINVPDVVCHTNATTMGYAPGVYATAIDAKNVLFALYVSNVLIPGKVGTIRF
jgi:hypothetical protein